MSNLESYHAERNRYIERAKNAHFLDAIFWMGYYNLHRKPPSWHNIDCEDINPEDVFASYDPEQYHDAKQKSLNLLRTHSGDIVQNDYNLYGEVLEQLKRETPGFSDECYKASLDRSMWMFR